MDLSKAFDSLNHDLLLLAKLEAYGFDNIAVSFIRSYFKNSLRRCKINTSFWGMDKNIVWVPTRIYIMSAIFQYFHQLHFLISLKM